MRKGRLSAAKQHKLIVYFVAVTTARCATDLIGVNRITAIYFYHRLREIVTAKLNQEIDKVLSGEI